MTKQNLTPEERRAVFDAGRASIRILTNPYPDEGTAARIWVDGWYAGFIERRNNG